MQVIIDGVRYLPERPVQEFRKPFHILIVSARKNKRETLREASKNMGISKSYLCNLEHGVNEPALGNLQKIIRYYGISFDQISD